MQSPEEALLVALLRQALLEARGVVAGNIDQRSSRRRIQAEAEMWILSRRTHAFSFTWTCHALRLDAEYVRRCRGRIIVNKHLNPVHGGRRRIAA